MSKHKNIECPTCSKKNTWTEENLSRPFCSPRCKLIDLGAWADESHRIPGGPAEQISPEKDDTDDNHS
ncbi:MAG TPA: DNA gyrase inhibitor YacG [Gammaproteobacteria bacterium]|jgi:hypothetical protein|nr:DNA gyrase inhibitor YacG [Gammaproteobacteria bacterium]